ncbi:hypothetical protein VP01_680g8 [Puccinia sorghi]|uniref:polynucleotide adenylyltransferase n=1 Tax=Puccinia sorghi TaxID=27349 RepID=A0A0L6UFC5_9BASI|nr:hypothetical protein VP01_680g8 [Puccinia sorghi]
MYNSLYTCTQGGLVLKSVSSATSQSIRRNTSMPQSTNTKPEKTTQLRRSTRLTTTQKPNSNNNNSPTNPNWSSVRTTIKQQTTNPTERSKKKKRKLHSHDITKTTNRSTKQEKKLKKLIKPQPENKMNQTTPTQPHSHLASSKTYVLPTQKKKQKTKNKTKNNPSPFLTTKLIQPYTPGSSSKPNNQESLNNKRPRGTKRKLGHVVTEEQAEEVRKKKGLIITPWFDRLSWKGRNVQQMLTAEIGSFVAYIQPTYEEHELRHMIIQMIRNTVQSRWPDADVEPFGSFGTKLYLPAGDIDLVILSTQMMNEQKSRILYKLAPLIRENNIGQDVVVIAKAKVPIIKFKTIFGNINVDISINQTNGIVAMKKVTELLDDIKYLSHDIRRSTRRSRDHHKSSSRKDYHPSRRHRRTPSPEHAEDEINVGRIVQDLGAAKCLILVVKSVLKQRGMNEVYTGGLGSYSIICLVVSFLQLHPKVQIGDIDPNKNLGVLLLEFFELYGKHFNFDQTGISVRRGGYYFSKAHRGWQRERQPYLLSIEDPADESNDIAGGSHNILSVRSVFSGAFDLLSATLYHRHSIQHSRDEAESDNRHIQPLLSVPVPKQQQQEEKSAQDHTENPKDPMAESLLGEIMGVTKELVENRKKNLKLFYSGTLQRLLNLPPPPPAGSKDQSSRNKDIASRPSDRDARRRVPPTSEDPKPQPSREDCPDGHAQRQLVRYDDMVGDSPGEGRKRPDKKGKRKEKTRRSPPPLWVEDVEPTEVEILKRDVFAGIGANKTEVNVPTTDVSPALSPAGPAPISRRLSGTPSVKIEGSAGHNSATPSVEIKGSAGHHSRTPSVEIEEPADHERRKRDWDGGRSGSSGFSCSSSQEDPRLLDRLNGAVDEADNEEHDDSRYQTFSKKMTRKMDMNPPDLLSRISTPPSTLSTSLFDNHSLLSSHQARGLAYFVDDESGSEV